MPRHDDGLPLSGIVIMFVWVMYGLLQGCDVTISRRKESARLHPWHTFSIGEWEMSCNYATLVDLPHYQAILGDANGAIPTKDICSVGPGSYPM